MPDDCLKITLSEFLQIPLNRVPNFVRRHGGRWKKHFHKWCANKEMFPIYFEDKKASGIGIMWVEKNKSTHAVILEKGKIVFDCNKEKRKYQGIREVICFQTSFPPRIITYKKNEKTR